jgi:hypothetical protein
MSFDIPNTGLVIRQHNEDTYSPHLNPARSWALLSWVDVSASTVVRTTCTDLAHDCVEALAMLASANQIDIRELMVVGQVLRRACQIGGVRYEPLLAEPRPQYLPTLPEWLWLLPKTLPPEYVERGNGPSFQFERTPTDVDVDALFSWLGLPPPAH